MTVDTTCLLPGLRLKNPIVLASGIIGTSPSLLERAARCGAGAVTSKSCSVQPRAGHPNPVAIDWGGGLINAIGLTNPGAAEQVPLLQETARLLAPLGVGLIASVFAGSLAEYAEVVRLIALARPPMLEVDISCPNVDDEFGTPFAASASLAATVTETVKKAAGGIPFSIKLAPAVPGIGRIAAAVAEAGADAITATNAVPGMIIDPWSGKAVLANKTGGVTGPAIKPVVLRSVYEIAKAVKIPIIGTGGVSCGTDAAEMIMAGATAVGVGSAVWYRGVEALGMIAAELADFMQAAGYPNLDSMRGLAHK